MCQPGKRIFFLVELGESPLLAVCFMKKKVKPFKAVLFLKGQI